MIFRWLHVLVTDQYGTMRKNVFKKISSSGFKNNILLSLTLDPDLAALLRYICSSAVSNFTEQRAALVLPNGYAAPIPW